MSPTPDVTIAAKSYPGYNEDWHLVGIQLDPTHQLAVPPRFAGQPGDDPKAFIYKITLEVLTSRPFLRMDDLKDQLALEQKRIIFASSFLDGPALEWFFDLLARNAAEYIPHENARRAKLPHWQLQLLEYDPEWPMVGITIPFVLDELSSSKRWTKALDYRFRHLPDPGPVRARAGSVSTVSAPGMTPGPYAAGAEEFKFREYGHAALASVVVEAAVKEEGGGGSV